MLGSGFSNGLNHVGQTGLGLSKAGLGQAQAQVLNSPREIGFLDRASGISSGLDSLRSKLESLSDRITGQGGDAKNAVSPIPCGLPAILGQTEDHLRRLHQIIDELNGKL